MNEAAENGGNLWPIITFAIYWAYLVVTYEQRKRNGVKTFFDFSASPPETGFARGHAFSWLTGLAHQRNELDDDSFLAGAVKMYEFVLTNYAAGNRVELVGYLAPDVFDVFSRHMEDRQANGEKLSLDIVTLTSARIVAKDISETVAEFTVRFEADILVSRQIRGADHTPHDSQEMLSTVDTWTFQKRKNALNKTWVLIATESE